MKTNEYTPDILNCLANLSNDEVFTPPEVANAMLDLLPQDLFRNPDTRFLDPCSKSGVFLREITKRLIAGLANQIPDLQERVTHILTHQVYGVALTTLTAEMSRRTLYCAKQANSEYSVAPLPTEDGNIYFQRLHHQWENGRCKHCGANQKAYERNDSLETYAYPFIHQPIKTIFPMQFDVIIGNPPYQLSDGSGASTDAAMPIYNKFIDVAKDMEPRYLLMIVPSKWMVGGRGLQTFRKKMIEDKHIRYVYDYENSADCFAGLHIDGGVNYFLWDKDNEGLCKYIYKTKTGEEIVSERYLKDANSDIVIRDTRRNTIIEKVTKDEHSFTSIVSSRKPFNVNTDLFNSPDRYPELNLQSKEYANSVLIWGVKGLKGGAKRLIGYVERRAITKNSSWIDKYKLFISKAYSTDAIVPPQLVVADKGVICTETFIVFGPFDTKKEQQNCLKYTSTNFFHILLFFGRGTMQVSQDVFRFVPLQDFTEQSDIDWSQDVEQINAYLYEKYKFTPQEQSFIESMIRPME